jgi:hypothetical protein
MTESVYELDEKSAKEFIKNSIKISAYATPVIEYEGLAVCVFCKKPIQAQFIENKWINQCSCEKSHDFSETRNILLNEFLEAKEKLNSIDSEVQEHAIKVFQEIYSEKQEERKVILEKNNSLIMNIKTFKEEDE